MTPGRLDNRWSHSGRYTSPQLVGLAAQTDAVERIERQPVRFQAQLAGGEGGVRTPALSMSAIL
jgi:hypothetical protein